MSDQTYTRLSGVNSVKVLDVIEIKSLAGNGTKGSPFYETTEYYSAEGKLLARNNGEILDNGKWVDTNG